MSAKRGDFALGLHGQLLIQIAVGHGGDDFDDAAHLVGQVGRHDVDGVGQVLPRAGHAGHLRLAAQLAFGADFARHARDFGGEGVELVHHDVDRVLEFENFAFDVGGDFLGQVAFGDGGGDFGDVADLRRQVAGHDVDGVGQVFPRSRDAGHDGLAAQLAFGADFARHARDFGGEGAELIDHRVDGLLELENFAAHIDGDFLGKVAVGHGDGHVGDVADLRRQVGRHGVDVVGQVLPGSGHAGHLRLAAQFAFGADFAGHAGDFRGERVQLIHHRVDGVLEFENFAFDVDGDLARKVAARDGGGDFGDVADLRR